MKKIIRIISTIISLIVLCLVVKKTLNNQEIQFDYRTSDKYYNQSQTIFENDFDYVFDILEKYYPKFARNKKTDFLNRREIFKRRISNVKDINSFINEMNIILFKLEDGHTSLLGKDGFEDFKCLLKIASSEKYFNKSLYNYLFESDDTNKVYESLDKTKFHNRNLTKLYQGDRLNLIAKDVNDDIGYIKINQMLDPASPGFAKDLEVLKSYLAKIKANKNALVIDLRGNSGGNSSYTQEYLYPMILGEDICKCKDEVYFLYKGGIDLMKYDIQYMELKDEFHKIDKKTLDEIFKNVSFLEEEKNLAKEIKDSFKYYIHSKSVYDKNSIDKSIKNYYKFNGRLYLLVDSRVYSSAEIASRFFRVNKLGTILGERTAGDGIGTSPAMFKLPNSKLIFRMEHMLGLADGKTLEESIYTYPDIEVDKNEFDFNNLLNDRCIKEIMKIENKSE